MITNDKQFWNDKGDRGTIYEMFRKNKQIIGNIRKPTGSKDTIIEIDEKYDINWNSIKPQLKYFEILIP